MSESSAVLETGDLLEVSPRGEDVGELKRDMLLRLSLKRGMLAVFRVNQHYLNFWSQD